MSSHGSFSCVLAFDLLDLVSDQFRQSAVQLVVDAVFPDKSGCDVAGVRVDQSLDLFLLASNANANLESLFMIIVSERASFKWTCVLCNWFLFLLFGNHFSALVNHRLYRLLDPGVSAIRQLFADYLSGFSREISCRLRFENVFVRILSNFDEIFSQVLAVCSLFVILKQLFVQRCGWV